MPTQNIFDLVDTWALSGGPYTSIKMNATDNDAASASLLMDLQVGGASKFSVGKAGGLTFAGNLQIANNAVYIEGTAVGTVRVPGAAGYYGFTTNTASSSASTIDTFISRRAAANLRFGAADAAAPVAQTLSVQSVVAGTTNTAGTALTITGSQGTGTGAGGSIIFQVAPAGSSGSAQNALATALTIDGATRGTVFDPGAFQSGGISFTGSTANIYSRGVGIINIGQSNTMAVELNYPAFGLSSDYYLGWSGLAGATGASGTKDVRLYRDATATLALRNGTAAQTFNLYNSYTDASNYSRLVMYADGSANYYIGTQKAGTGNSASLFVGTGAGAGVAGNGALTLAGSSVGITTQIGNVFTITASGVMSWNTDNSYDIGASSAARPRSVYAGTSITPGAGVVVASLPTPTTGMMARVTDATLPVIGSAVAGGGAAQALVWYNGANWTVIGV